MPQLGFCRRGTAFGDPLAVALAPHLRLGVPLGLRGTTLGPGQTPLAQDRDRRPVLVPYATNATRT